MARANHMENGKIVDEGDVIQGVVLLRKGADAGPTLDAIHAKVKELNETILPRGVKIVPMLDRADLLHFTLHTVEHNLVEGMILVTIILFLFLGQCSCRSDRGMHDTVLIAVCVYLARFEQDPSKPPLPGRA